MSFDIDDILKELEEKGKNKSEVTAYLDRHFLDGMIKEYYQNLPENTSSLFAQTQVNINEYNFTGADLRGMKEKDLNLFDFTNCDISAAHIDRVGLEFFKEYIRKQTISYIGIIVDGANLGPKIYENKKLGIRCKIYLNLSGLNLSGISFKNCNLLETIFDDADISRANFTNSRQLSVKQFIYSNGFESAIFFEDKKLDRKFKDEITKLSKNKRPEIVPFISKTHNSIAQLFDNPDQIRLDDKGYLKNQNEIMQKDKKNQLFDNKLLI